MRTSAAIVAVVVLIASAATVDALRDGGSFTPVPETTDTREPSRPPPRAAPEETLRAAGVSGRLYFSVEVGRTCFVRSLNLPDLEDAAEVAVESCGFDVSPKRAIVASPPCPSRSFSAYSTDRRSAEYDGCAAAWRPDGELTFVRGGDLVTRNGVLIRNVARFARNALGRGSPLLVQQVAWLTNTRLAVRVTTRAPGISVVVVLDEGRAASEPLFADREAQMEVSHGTEEILVTFSGGGVQVFGPNGAFVSATRFPFGSIAALAYSPDGRFVALARPGNLCIYEETDPPPRERFPVACLPFDDVRDLAWTQTADA